MLPTRPTLRCLRVDLQIPLPSLNMSLEEVEHPLIAKAVEQFSDPAASRERIRAIDDQVFHKVKVQRWRGAAWVDTKAAQPWLVAAGQREEGSDKDFYQALTAEVEAARAQYNTTHTPALTTRTYSSYLLPTNDDHKRYAAEAGLRLIRQLDATVRQLTRAALLDGHEHFSHIAGARIGIQVRADEGHETYVALRITGSIPVNFTALVLDAVPGCNPKDWLIESDPPTRATEPGEQIWSNLMDPADAAALLSDDQS